MDRAEAEAIHDSGRDACVKVLLALANQVQRLEGRVERLEGEVRELRRDSANSSLPPSADPGAGKHRRKGKRSPRKPGAQPGHPGSGRGLLPIEQVDEVIEHLPGSCAQCGHSLADRPARGPIRRHQVAELPETAVAVTEHRLCRRRCPDCGALTQAELPPEIPRERFGPRLQGAIATLAAGFRLSRRQVADLCGELFGSQIAVGSVDAILGRQGIALREPQERLCDAVRSAPVLCVDETGRKQAGETRFLWGAFADRAAVLGSPPPVTARRPKRCSAKPRRSSPRTAGGHMTISTPPVARSAGHTFCATFASTPRARSSTRASSARPVWGSPRRCSRPGATFSTHGDRRALRRG